MRQLNFVVVGAPAEACTTRNLDGIEKWQELEVESGSKGKRKAKMKRKRKSKSKRKSKRKRTGLKTRHYILEGTLAQEKSMVRAGTPVRGAMVTGLNFSMRPSLTAWE